MLDFFSYNSSNIIGIMKIKQILIALLFLLIGFLGGYLTRYPINEDYKLRLHGSCNDLALDYLSKVERVYGVDTHGEPEWRRAVDVETDIFNLCGLNLDDEESLKNFKSTVIEKYHR